MLQDGIIVRGDWIKDAANQATAVKFLEASFKGWIYCRDHLAECTNIVLKNGPALPKGHQRWQMNEVNALIWPNKLGVGIMDPVEFKRTATIAKTYKVIKKPAIQGRVPDGSREEGVANLKKAGPRRHRQELQEEGRRPQGGREVTTRHELRAGSRPARSSPADGGEMTCRH